MDPVFSLLQKPLLSYLLKSHILQASNIQKLAIPKILEGNNVLLIAPTGMGKTLAVILPIFDMYLKFQSEFDGHGIKILYITPLRALNRDIYRRVIELGDTLGIKTEVRHGDTPIKVRKKQAVFPPDMLITTPETLQAILPGKRLKQHLKNVKWIIIDEIHELAIDKRGAQLSLGLERLHNLVEKEYQRIGLSATIGNPETIAAFLAGTDRNTKIIKSLRKKAREVTVEYTLPTKEDEENSEKIGVPPSYISKIRKIIDLTSKSKSTLIFTNTREHTEAIGSLINAINSQIPIMVHHGSLSREVREEAEKRFLTGDIKGIVCTSSLELGIDVGTVNLVIHYMSPRQAIRLVQRVGRSGHSIQAIPKGKIITNWLDDILEAAIIVKRAEKEDLEHSEIPNSPYDVLAHQIVGMALDEKGIKINKIYKIIKNAFPYRNIPIEKLSAIISQLEKLRLLIVRDDTIKPRIRSYRYYYENLSVIPDIKRYNVFDFINKRKIGTLDQEFVVKRCYSKQKIIMRGHTWEVINRDDEKLSINVEPTTPTLEAIPSWEGEIIPVDLKTAKNVGQLREKIATTIGHNQNPKLILKQYRINDNAVNKATEIIVDHIKKYDLPTHQRILIERYENILIIHACFGTKVNETLGLVISSLLKSKYDSTFMYQVDAYRIAIKCPYPINTISVKKTLIDLQPKDLKIILNSVLMDSEIFIWRHWNVSKRFGIVEKKADYNHQKARMLVNIFRETVVCEETKKEIYHEKLDLSNTEEIITQITEGKIEIIIEEKDTPTPLATPILDKLIPHGLLRPVTPTKSLVSIIKERLTTSTIKLMCIHKGDWEGIRVINDLPDRIRCPKCKSTLIAAVHPNNTNLLTIIKKKIKKVKLNADEKSEWMQGWRSASLIQIYGKKAVIVLAGYGVGPLTATRILKIPVKNNAEFYVNILKAERLYARTRSFWD